MSFTENAIKVVSDTTDNVFKASGEFIENSKIRYRIYDAKIDIKRLYEKLGKLTYAEYEKGEDSSLKREEICQKINEIKQYISEQQRKLK